MLQERYHDKDKLITDADELQLTDDAEVLIYRESKWESEVVVCLEEQAEQFEKLKPFIVSVAENLCKMDYMAQKYDRDSRFGEHYCIAYIRLDAPDRVILTYYGMIENTEFDVVFQWLNGEFLLKRFGMVKDIPPDWDKNRD